MCAKTWTISREILPAKLSETLGHFLHGEITLALLIGDTLLMNNIIIIHNNDRD